MAEQTPVESVLIKAVAEARADNERLRTALTEVRALLQEYVYAADRLLDGVTRQS